MGKKARQQLSRIPPIRRSSHTKHKNLQQNPLDLISIGMHFNPAETNTKVIFTLLLLLAISQRAEANLPGGSWVKTCNVKSEQILSPYPISELTVSCEMARGSSRTSTFFHKDGDNRCYHNSDGHIVSEPCRR